jgi:hypothetical protein
MAGIGRGGRQHPRRLPAQRLSHTARHSSTEGSRAVNVANPVKYAGFRDVQRESLTGTAKKLR